MLDQRPPIELDPVVREVEGQAAAGMPNLRQLLFETAIEAAMCQRELPEVGQILGIEAQLTTHTGIAAEKHALAIEAVDTRPTIGPRQRLATGSIDAFFLQAIEQVLAIPIIAHAAQVGASSAKPGCEYRDVERIPARIFDVPVQVYIQGVIAHCDQAGHAQYSVFHM